MPDTARNDTTEQVSAFDSPKAAGALTIGALAVLVVLHRLFRSAIGG